MSINKENLTPNLAIDRKCFFIEFLAKFLHMKILLIIFLSCLFNYRSCSCWGSVVYTTFCHSYINQIIKKYSMINYDPI